MRVRFDLSRIVASVEGVSDQQHTVLQVADQVGPLDLSLNQALLLDQVNEFFPTSEGPTHLLFTFRCSLRVFRQQTLITKASVSYVNGKLVLLESEPIELEEFEQKLAFTN